MAEFTDPQSAFTNTTQNLESNDGFRDNTSVAQLFAFSEADFPVGSYGYIRHMLWRVVAPIIIIPGTVGNLITILVFLKSSLKVSSTALYLSTLAFSNTLLLWCAPFGTWLRYTWSVDLQILGEYGCKARLLASSICLNFSSWILVAVTMERAVSVVVPLKAKIYCRPKIAGIVLVVTLILLVGCGVAVFFLGEVKGYNLVDETNELGCATTTFQEPLLHSTSNMTGWVDLLLSYAAPFLFLLIGNTIIIREIHRSRKMQSSLRIARRPRESSSKQISVRSLTVQMIVLCIVFLLTMTPVSMFHIYCPIHYSDIKELMKTDMLSARKYYQYLLLQRTIVDLVSYTNTSFNFVLYVLSGSKFREQLKSMCCCRKQRNSSVINRSIFSESTSGDTTLSKLCSKSVKIGVSDRTKSMTNFQQKNKWKEGFLIKKVEQEGIIEQCNIAFIDDYGSSISSILSTAQETFDSEDMDNTFDSIHEPIQPARENVVWGQQSSIYSTSTMCPNKGSKETEFSGFLLWM